MSWKFVLTTCISVLLALILGYWVGVEHTKISLRRSFGDVLDSVNLAEQQVQLNDLNAIGSIPSASTSTKKPTVTRLKLGEAHKDRRFTIQVDKIVIDKPQVRGAFNTDISPEKPFLLVYMTVKNNDERRVLTFYERSNVGSFGLHDDVENLIHHAHFESTQYVFGAMHSSDVVNPGESKSHIEVFEIPLPKTKLLLFKIDLSCFDDGAGEIEYQIPFDQIGKAPE